MAQKTPKVGDTVTMDGVELEITVVGKVTVKACDAERLECARLTAGARDGWDYDRALGDDEARERESSLAVIPRGLRMGIGLRNIIARRSGDGWTVPGRLLSMAERLRWRERTGNKSGPPPANHEDAKDYLAYLDTLEG